jgi:GntR family transcriptional regulator/MocR family aminotransferase
MILPPELLALWKKHHAYYYSLVSKTEQYALAEFIKKGYFTKHYKNMRRIYKDKRKYLTDCFTEAFGDKIKICGGAGSTYITAELEGMNAEEIKLLARQNGVKLLSENSYNVKKDTSPMKNDKLVIGFGDLQREKIKLGIHLLKDSLNYI